MQFNSPGPGNANQTAYAVDPGDSSRVFSITAIPFGSSAGIEGLAPVSAATNLAQTRGGLRALRQAQGGSPAPGPSANLFGQAVEGITSLVNLPGVTTEQPAALTEWVLTAGNRLWIIRAVHLLPAASKADLSPAQGIAAEGIAIQSSTLSRPSTSLVYQPDAQPAVVAPRSSTGILAAPTWWNGPCDTFNYHLHTKTYYAYPLGTSYRGIEACGPGSATDGALDVVVNYFPGSWGELEWECVELSMRFLYLADGINPYRANGNQVVLNYKGTVMDKVANGTVNVVPVPGDVLSYCSYCAVGHTTVVISSAVGNTGNGTITVMEQNNTQKGQSTLKVTAWVVAGNAGPVIGWLHLHGTPNLPTPFYQYAPLITQ